MLVVGVTDSRAEADTRRVAATVSFPVAHIDGAFLRRFGVESYPVSVFLGRDGKVASRIDGMGDLTELESRVKKLL